MTADQRETLCGFIIVAGASGVEWAMHGWLGALLLLVYYIGAIALVDYAMSR